MKTQALFMFGLSAALCATLAHAEQGEVNFTATSANVKESGTPVKIRVVRWSTEKERNPIVAALNPAPPVTAPAGRAGELPAGAGPNPAAATGRGRGRGRGGRATAPAAPLSPTAALTAAIAKAPTIGYIWTNDITGYSIKYAQRMSLPDGGERIILATDRRLGAHTTGWSSVAATLLTDYEFTLIEIRLDAKGLGEGKTSLTGKVIVDDEAKTVALDNYVGTPVILQNVKR